MKKYLLCIAICITMPLMFAACKKNTDYFDYVSEYRNSVYFYEDDNITVKIYGVDRETPYALDGIKGNMNSLTEIYYSCEGSANEVEIELGGRGGEMSWLAVTRNYYLSFTGGNLSGASVPVTITVDGVETKIDAFNVAEEGTIDGRTALDCVREYDAESFTSLTHNGVFSGEIIVRLLYDEGCYYYVGVCDGENVHAYLVDGSDGRIIAERESTVED